MGAKTVDTIGVVDASGNLTVKVRTDMPPGEHPVQLVLTDNGVGSLGDLSWLELEVGQTKAGFPPRREELYDDGEA